MGSWIIACFDLANETYRVVVRPKNRDTEHDHRLGVLGDCISVFYNYEGNHADIWVMKECGVKWSWIKVFSIPYVDRPLKSSAEMSRPICMSRNGEVLFVLSSELLLYNPKADTFRRYPKIGCLHNAVMYVESLVSPGIHDTVQPRNSI
ncbi:OLC1v1003123C1 [Oldenlandia corymbosa var. corymbosa]|uniref:OLC1v1003123C1 n=1 Tax=Oldenlandia corymbosa var. corymbosa TaxID=529605 RepID=A0AAV1DBQ0_OLDCO|nr:OLC1v1003123C1 [Oldenlandia corymbosa var. corymbosa]